MKNTKKNYSLDLDGVHSFMIFLKNLFNNLLVETIYIPLSWL